MYIGIYILYFDDDLSIIGFNIQGYIYRLLSTF